MYDVLERMPWVYEGLWFGVIACMFFLLIRPRDFAPFARRLKVNIRDEMVGGKAAKASRSFVVKPAFYVSAFVLSVTLIGLMVDIEIPAFHFKLRTQNLPSVVILACIVTPPFAGLLNLLLLRSLGYSAEAGETKPRRRSNPKKEQGVPQGD